MPEEEQIEYFAQMITERDRKSQLKTATRIGIEKGIEKVAKKMKQAQMPIQEIAAVTELSIEQIETL